MKPSPAGLLKKKHSSRINIKVVVCQAGKPDWEVITSPEYGWIVKITIDQCSEYLHTRRCTVFSFLAPLMAWVGNAFSKPRLVRLARLRDEAWQEVDYEHPTKCRLIQLAAAGVLHHALTRPLPLVNISRKMADRMIIGIILVVMAFVGCSFAMSIVESGISRTLMELGLPALIGITSAVLFFKLVPWGMKTAAKTCPIKS